MFVGYSVFYYGITQIRSQNYGFLDLVLPSKWQTVRLTPPGPDSGASNTLGAKAGSFDNANPSGQQNLLTLTAGNGTYDQSALDAISSDQVNVNGQTLTLDPSLRQGNEGSTGEGGFSDPLAGGSPTSGGPLTYDQGGPPGYILDGQGNWVKP
jgi:hypothetical protein